MEDFSEIERQPLKTVKEFKKEQKAHKLERWDFVDIPISISEKYSTKSKEGTIRTAEVSTTINLNLLDDRAVELLKRIKAKLVNITRGRQYDTSAKKGNF